MNANPGHTIRILSYNVRHGQGVASWLSNARLARVISGIDPAVAGLQEVWQLGLYDQPARLGERTELAAFYHATHPVLAGSTGNLLLTRGTIHGTHLLDLGGKREQRGCLVADIEVDGARFDFALTHLSLHRHTRGLQIRRLADQLPATQPLVLVGDFNCERIELEPLFDRLTFSEPPLKTFPSIYPLRALDHIGYSEHWALEQFMALPSLASDHLPLVADLRLR